MFSRAARRCRCADCRFQEPWDDRVPDLQQSSAQPGVTALELEQIHVDFSKLEFAVNYCLQSCCLKGTDVRCLESKLAFFLVC